MNPLQEIILNNEAPNEAKCLALLLSLIKKLGWESCTDNRVIKPNLRAAQLYIRRNLAKFNKLFNLSFDNLNKYDLVDTINPLLIKVWSMQIVGDPYAAHLELLIKN